MGHLAVQLLSGQVFIFGACGNRNNSTLNTVMPHGNETSSSRVFAVQLTECRSFGETPTSTGLWFTDFRCPWCSAQVALGVVCILTLNFVWCRSLENLAQAR